MKKLILVTFLTLLSFNAKARCFEGDVDDDYSECNILEAITRLNNQNVNFIHYYSGFTQGLAYGEMSKNLNFYSKYQHYFSKCVRTSAEVVHNKILTQYLLGEIDKDYDYTSWMSTMYSKQWLDCMAKEIEKEQQP